MLDVLPFGIAHHMALVPLVWLAWTRPHDRAWWWLGGAFAISWLADIAAHWVSPWLTSLVYPVSQAAIIAAVLTTRQWARGFVTLLIVAGLIAVALEGIGQADILLRTVAWLGIVAVASGHPALPRLQLTLWVTFGLGWACWMFYAALPSWPTWSVYQAVRACGIGLFCWASRHPAARLRLA